MLKKVFSKFTKEAKEVVARTHVPSRPIPYRKRPSAASRRPR